jgi:LEA14-like dessication related protein
MARMLPRAPLLIVLSLLVACTPHFEKPTVSVVGVQLQGGNLWQQNFLVTLKVHNPNGRVLPVSRLSAELRTDGEEIASGESNGAFKVPAFGDADFGVAVKANMALLLLQLSKRHDARSDQIDYDVSGVVSLDLPFLRSLAFHQNGAFAWRPDSG